MHQNNFNFKLLSLNVRGIRTSDKRKGLFTWINNQKADIYFLQETYSTEEIELEWRKQWRGELFFSHGTNHSKGVLILFRNDLDFKIISTTSDPLGRYVMLELMVQDALFLFVNIYAPNKTSDQCDFVDTLGNNIDEKASPEHNIILGGDFNVILDQDLDACGGTPSIKNSV